MGRDGERKETDVLVVIPHPDDAEFGVAGTVARWVKQGKEVIYAVCTYGEKGTSDPAVRPEDLARTRAEEQRAAAGLLGVKKVVFLGHPDQGMEETPEFRKEIVRLIRTYRPQTVATPDPYRRYIWHRDHRIVGQVTLEAIFPYARDHLAYPDLLEEGLQPHKVREVLCWGSENVNYRSDITETFSMKLSALRCHKSQVGDLPPEELESRLLERHRGMAAGEEFELAEAFHREEILR